MKDVQELSRVFSRRRRVVLARVRRGSRADAFLVTHRPDVTYLSGFSGEDSALLFGGGWAVLVTDFRFAEQAPQECPGAEIHVRARTHPLEVETAKLFKRRDLRHLAVQGDHLTVSRHTTLKRALRSRKLVPVSDVLLDVRAVKDESEIRTIRRAVRIAEGAFRDMLRRGAKHFVGKSERELAGELDGRMRVAGADRSAFDTIVAAGPNGSRCHHLPSSRRVRKGDGILFDWGADYRGYHSDMTRVVFVGPVAPRMQEVYEIVLEAHDRAVNAIRTGVLTRSVDCAARDFISRAGFGSEFGHGLGHGIGLEIHEQPRLAATSTGRLRRDMVVTVEPGIYLPGVGGVRIEDDILVTREGPVRLNTLPRDLHRMLLR